MAFQDIRKSGKWLSTADILFLAGVVAFVFALLALNIYLARALPGGEWFLLRWNGARAFLVDNMEPYGTAMAQRVQNVVYGRNAFSSEYPYVLNDPFYIVLLYTPLAFLREIVSLFSLTLASSVDYAFPRGIWMLFSEVAVVGIVFYSVKLSEWQPPRWLLVCLIGFSLFSFFSLNALVSGTPTIILAFLYVSILLALRSYYDELAGALLLLVAYQWEVGALFFLYILVLVFAHRRWNVLAGFGMSLFVLLIVSFLSYSGWMLPYARAVLSDWYRGSSLIFGHIVSYWISTTKISIGTWMFIALGILLFMEWIGSVKASFRHIVWTASLSLAATPLMGFAVFSTNHVVLILPLVLILSLAWERWVRNRALVNILVLAFAFVIPFGLYFQTTLHPSRIYSDLLTVLPPVATIIGLYWMRWWAVRSPRIWADQLGNKK